MAHITTATEPHHTPRANPLQRTFTRREICNSNIQQSPRLDCASQQSPSPCLSQLQQMTVFGCFFVMFFNVCHSSWYGVFVNQKVSIFFLFLNENICCGYSLEVPQRGKSNEYLQHMFLSRNKKTVYLIPTLI